MRETKNMNKGQMLGARLPLELVRDLELIEVIEQTDRSSIARRLLAKAVRKWKLEYYARQYGDGKLTLARAVHDAGVSLWETMKYSRARKVAPQYALEALRQDLGTISGSTMRAQR